ncbi:hypothetical protein GCM10018790_78570 [Kitasatospora xanthocidica]|nr:hypothetical protein GCM10018790_78570 [Kitasatospora xanthocidica]
MPEQGGSEQHADEQFADDGGEPDPGEEASQRDGEPEQQAHLEEEDHQVMGGERRDRSSGQRHGDSLAGRGG